MAVMVVVTSNGRKRLFVRQPAMVLLHGSYSTPPNDEAGSAKGRHLDTGPAPATQQPPSRAHGAAGAQVPDGGSHARRTRGRALLAVPPTGEGQRPAPNLRDAGVQPGVRGPAEYKITYVRARDSRVTFLRCYQCRD